MRPSPKTLFIPVLTVLVVLLSLGVPLANSTKQDEVSLRPDAPIRFVAGEDTELSFELVVTNAEGETRLPDVERFPGAKIQAEVSFFCFGGNKIFNRVLELRPEDGSFKVQISVPGVAMSGDLALSISPLPEAVDSQFRDLHPVVVDQTVEPSSK
jgi:hypothetical protein